VSKPTIIHQIHLMAEDRGAILSRANSETRQQLEKLIPQIVKGGCRRVYVIGCGTSYYAAMVCKHVFEEMAGVPTEALQAFDFATYQNPALLDAGALVVGFSTAGDTVAVLDSLRKARQGGATTVAVTALPESPVAKAADVIVLTGATDEVAVCRTKGQIQGLLTLYLLAAHIGRSLGCLSEADMAKILGELERSVQGIAATILKDEKCVEALAATYKGCKSVFVLGSGANIGAAHTGALMITEMAKVHALADDFENFLHGRDREFDPMDPLFILAPKGGSSARVLDFLTVSSHVKAPTIVLTDAPSEEIKGLATHVITLQNSIRESMTPLVFLVPLLLFAHHVAVTKGQDPNVRRYTDIVPTKMKFAPKKQT